MSNVKRAILYARVSTDEQAKSGYSLAQQLDALRVYAAHEGYEVLEEVQDPGQSGASLERPGMDRVRDLVAAGDVAVVLAQDRDRLAREPAYLYLLREEFAEHGTTIRAMNDRGDDSPEGELTDGILDQLAKFERAKIAERTRRGRLRKAKEGKIVAAAPRATYGFTFNETRDSYQIDYPEADTVLRIFEMVADGTPLSTAKRLLEQDSVPAPNGQAWWNSTTVRDIVEDDCYRPYTFKEVADMVNPEVAAGLDPDKPYGVWWYNRRRTIVRQVADHGPKGRRYRKVQRTTKKPRNEWVAVPVPDVGIPRDLVDAARERIRHNTRTSKAGDDFWELSGGVFFCGGCGNRMVAHRSRRTPDSPYFAYYRCETRKKRKAACPMPKSFRSDKIESLVWDFVSGLLKNPERLQAGLEEMIEQKKRNMRGDPDRETRTWLDKLSEVDCKRSAYQDQQAESLITIDELKTKLTALEETRAVAHRELEALQGYRQEIEQLERDADALMGQYAGRIPGDLDDLDSEQRHHIYGMMKLRVIAHVDGSVEANGERVEELSVCTNGASSA